MTLPEDVAIQATGLSKKYRLFDSPRQRLKEALDPWGRTFHKDFWALRDIDLIVQKGHTVGIIGRNGSGKSTLLQLITSVLYPTAGTIEVAGRIAALLELGAGFDPDFTGRDNARQYGLLQGLMAAEIEYRLPEIEEFAGIGEFFDRPVRTYSSGMFARLAFAAAINVDPDILILDEILAVGDVRFQQRSFERIIAFQEASKTVLLVSHSLETIIDHCDTALLLDHGRLIALGPPKVVVDRFRELLLDEAAKTLGHVRGSHRPTLGTIEGDQRQSIESIATHMLDEPSDQDRFPTRPGYNPESTLSGSGQAKLLDYRLVLNDVPTDSSVFPARGHLRLLVLTRFEDWREEAQFGFALRRFDGLYIYGTNSVMRPTAFVHWDRGNLLVFSWAVKLDFQAGHYFFDLGVYRDISGDTIMLGGRRNVIQITVLSTPDFDGIVDLGIDE